MRVLDIRYPRPLPLSATSVCGVIGSFDPLHRGHEGIIEQLLARFEVVLALIPTAHFEKTVRFPVNATYDQRLRMLTAFAEQKGDRVVVGLTHEVLFLRLAARLRAIFSEAAITFGMGNETFECFLQSKTYYTRQGLPWTASDRADLERLQHQIVVFGRSGHGQQMVGVPDDLRRISSTQVRRIVGELRKTGVSDAEWRQRLSSLVSPQVAAYIRKTGVYVNTVDVRLKTPINRESERSATRSSQTSEARNSRCVATTH